MAKYEVNEKVRPLILRDNETKDVYTLEFSRDSVRFAESRGFSISSISDFPMTKIPELFFYAFRMHHKNIAREKTDKILFEDLGGLREGMLERLYSLYSAPFDALANDGEDNEKNSRMTVEF
jgi:hypothetical protein